MLYRIGPAMVSLAMASVVPRCTHFPDGDGGLDGYAGASASGASEGGAAGTTSGAGGTISSHGGSGGAGAVGGSLGAGEGGGAGMASGGSAGMSGGSGTGGASGSAGAATTGGAAGSGGGSATGHLVLSTPFVAFPFATCNGIANLPASFTLSNGSNAPFDWSTTVTESSPFFSIAPTGSSLLPGETVTVTVAPSALASGSLPHGFSPSFSGTIAISGDPAGTQTVSVTEPIMGIDISWTPVNLDFGMVPISNGPPVGNPSATQTVTESAPLTSSPIQLSSDNPSFTANLTAPLPPRSSWAVAFAPTKLGPQSATLTWGTQTSSSIFCSAHTFTATGTGIVLGAASCAVSSILPGTPCGTNQICAFGGGCVTELTLVGSPVASSAGSLFSGAVATGKVANGAQSAALTANIDWGDQTVSAGSIVLAAQSTPSGLPFTVNGSHTYASAGSFQGTVTVTDPSTTFSAVATFTASN
jgi:hypothetical protein